MSFPCPPGTHSTAPAPGLICNCARLGDLHLRQIIPQLLLWEFHIFLRNIWPWCFLQMEYWVRGSLDHMKTRSQIWLFLTSPLNLLIQHSLLISYRQAVPACQKVTVCSTQAAYESLGIYRLSPIPWINQLNSRRIVLGAAPSLTSVQDAARGT